MKKEEKEKLNNKYKLSVTPYDEDIKRVTKEIIDNKDILLYLNNYEKFCKNNNIIDYIEHLQYIIDKLKTRIYNLNGEKKLLEYNEKIYNNNGKTLNEYK